MGQLHEKKFLSPIIDIYINENSWLSTKVLQLFHPLGNDKNKAGNLSSKKV